MKAGRVIVSTGAAEGIGRRIVDRFVTNGNLAIADFREVAKF